MSDINIVKDAFDRYFSASAEDFPEAATCLRQAFRRAVPLSIEEQRTALAHLDGIVAELLAFENPVGDVMERYRAVIGCWEEAERRFELASKDTADLVRDVWDACDIIRDRFQYYCCVNPGLAALMLEDALALDREMDEVSEESDSPEDRRYFLRTSKYILENLFEEPSPKED